MRFRAVVILAALVTAGVACEKGNPLRSQNGQPSGSFTFTPGGPALAGATEVAFSASATDPDGDALSYAWDFGDGATGSGQNVRHVFDTTGALNVVLTVQDGKSGSVTSSKSVEVRSLTGRWIDIDPRFRVDLVQNGRTFTGSVTVAGFGQVSTINAGILRDPRDVAFHRQSSVPGFATVDYRGSLDATLNHMNVVAIQNAATSFNLTRE
jgi:PKD repeat protein